MRYFPFLFLVLVACGEKTQEIQKHIVLLPKADKFSKSYSGDEVPFILNVPVYIGSFPDTVDINKAIRLDTVRMLMFEDAPFKKKSNSSPYGIILKLIGIENHIVNDGIERLFFASEKNNKKDSISVFVDTAILASSEHLLRFLPGERNPGEGWNTNKIQCYPVIINNIGHDTLFFYDLNIEIEASTTSITWKRIARNNEGKCRTGEPIYWFAPGETMVSYIPKYEGKLKAEFRIKYELDGKPFYSQIYHGSLNPGLLQK